MSARRVVAEPPPHGICCRRRGPSARPRRPRGVQTAAPTGTRRTGTCRCCRARCGPGGSGAPLSRTAASDAHLCRKPNPGTVASSGARGAFVGREVEYDVVLAAGGADLAEGAGRVLEANHVVRMTEYGRVLKHERMLGKRVLQRGWQSQGCCQGKLGRTGGNGDVVRERRLRPCVCSPEEPLRRM